MEPLRFAILMPWGRVGSNLVMNIIAQSGPTKLANETFNTIKGEAEQLAWYREHYELGAETPSKPVIGCKQNVLSISDPRGLGQAMLRDGIKVVRMRRDNLVKVAVSQIRGRIYADEARQRIGRPKWALHKNDTPLGPISVDPGLLQARLKAAERAHGALMDMFRSEDVLDIEYDEINTRLAAVVHRLRDWLRLENSPEFKVAYKKATPDDLRAAVTNFDELSAALAGTPYAAQLTG